MTPAKTSLNRAALKGGVATIAIAMFASSGAAWAQAAVNPAAAAAEATDGETIVVTGSLIKNPNLVSASPITVTTADTIQLRGANVAEEVLRDIPGIVPSIGSAARLTSIFAVSVRAATSFFSTATASRLPISKAASI